MKMFEHVVISFVFLVETVANMILQHAKHTIGHQRLWLRRLN